jgi:serine/threonine protein kinase
VAQHRCAIGGGGVEIPIGSTVGGYRVEQKLGEGGMGAVYRARHRSLPKDVALKVLWPSYLRIPQFRERFEQEADVLCRLEHPNVVTVLDKGEDDDMLWIAMQFVDGVDLHTALVERGPFPPAQAVEIVAAVGRALDHAHERGLLHRDVKPANIMLKRGTGEAMLTDFGIAKDAALASPLTQTGMVLGTFAYSAPEQLNGGPMDGRADVYSLGAVLFELLTGRKAFPQEGQYQLLAAVSFEPAPDVRTVRPDVPPALAAVVGRALAKDPAQRYPTGAALADAARTALQPRAAAPPTVLGAGQPSPDDVATEERVRPAPTLPSPPPVQPPLHAPAPGRRRAPLWIAAALVVVVAAIVLGVVLTSGNGGGNGGNAAATDPTSAGSTSAGGTSAAGGSTSLAVGACVSDGGGATACDGPHAAEVYSDGECTMAALVGYLGGTPGEDPLTSLLTLGTADIPGGAVCTVAAPQPTQGASQGVLGSSAGAIWRRCRDDRGTDVLCTKPHKTEVVYDGTEAADPTAAVDCTGRATAFIGKPFGQVQDKLTLQPDGSLCLLSVRGDNVMTDSLHGLKSSALPIEAATD